MVQDSLCLQSKVKSALDVPIDLIGQKPMKLLKKKSFILKVYIFYLLQDMHMLIFMRGQKLAKSNCYSIVVNSFFMS